MFARCLIAIGKTISFADAIIYLIKDRKKLWKMFMGNLPKQAKNKHENDRRLENKKKCSISEDYLMIVTMHLRTLLFGHEGITEAHYTVLSPIDVLIKYVLIKNRYNSIQIAMRKNNTYFEWARLRIHDLNNTSS